MCSVPAEAIFILFYEELIGRAYDELKETGLLCVDTEIALNTFGIDPEICKEEAERH